MAQNVSVTNVAHDKQVRCFYGCRPYPSSDDYYNKCIRVGTGWNVANANASFAISEVKSSSSVANVDVYFFRQGCLLQFDVQPGSIPLACLANGSVPSNTHCDWDKFFSSNLPHGSEHVQQYLDPAVRNA
jgi:hypothetical protein